MSDNLDAASQSFGNFSIENTIEMGGMGSTELLNDLLGPETSTSSPDDIQEIVKTIPEDNIKKKEPATKSEPAKEETQEDKAASIKDFLLGGDEDEEEEVPAVKSAAKKENVVSSEEESEEDASSIFSTLSKELYKLNVFTQEDEEEEQSISTPEQFLEKFQNEKKKGAIEIVNNFIGQFGEDYQEAFQAIFVKGVNPKDYFNTYNNIQSFSEMDLSQENNQVAVLRQALTDQGFETEDIDTEIERLRNYGDLESVSVKHHKVLLKKETAKLQQIEQEKEAQLNQQSAIKQKYIQNVQTVLQDKLKAKEFDGIPINPKLAGELQDFLLVDKYKTPSGELLTEFDRTILDLKRPENHENKVKVALLLKIIEKDPTLSTIQKTGITKKSNELFGEVARQATKASVKTGNKSANTSSWFNGL
jgi:hypothetical protein